MFGLSSHAEELLNSAIEEITAENYALLLDDGASVGDLVEAARDYMSEGEFALAFEELESIGAEFEISDAFHAYLADAAALMGEEEG